MKHQHIRFGKPEREIGNFYKVLKPVDSPERRAALAVLKTKVPEYGELAPVHGDIWHLEGVYFGPFLDEQYEPAVPEEGREERNPTDEARIAYWWGNSNLYKPITLEQWTEALRKELPT
jgi:hypothetical protein